MTAPTTYQPISLGDFALGNGYVLTNAQIGIATWGASPSKAERIVVLPSYYSGTALSYAPWIGADGLFDPTRCCIASFDQFGAGKSSKPSDNGSLAKWGFPSLADSVRAQKYALDVLGVQSVDMVAGWSMGGMQAFAWYALFPDFIGSALAICATPSASAVNRVFLEGIRSVLVGKHDAESLRSFDALLPEQKQARLAAFGAVYAGWAYSDEFFLSGAYRDFGYESPEAVVAEWAKDHEAMNAANLAAQLDAWLTAKTPATKAQANGQPKPLVAMPCRSDRYFLTETLADAQSAFPSLKIAEIDSDLGHIAGRPGIRPKETSQIKQQVNEIFRSIPLRVRACSDP